MSRGRWTGVASSRGGQRHGLKMYAPTIFGRRPKKRVLCVFNHRPNFPLKNLHYLCSPDLVKEPTLGDSSPLVFHFFLVFFVILRCFNQRSHLQICPFLNNVRACGFARFWAQPGAMVLPGTRLARLPGGIPQGEATSMAGPWGGPGTRWGYLRRCLDFCYFHVALGERSAWSHGAQESAGRGAAAPACVSPSSLLGSVWRRSCGACWGSCAGAVAYGGTIGALA